VMIKNSGSDAQSSDIPRSQTEFGNEKCVRPRVNGIEMEFGNEEGVFHNTLLYLISTSIPASGALVMLFLRTSTTLLRCCTLNSMATLAAADSTLSSKFVAMTQSGSNLGSIVNETLFISDRSGSVFCGLLLVKLTTPLEIRDYNGLFIEFIKGFYR